MGEIRPFKGYRYNNNLSQNIATLISPLFDVVSEKQLQQLYKNSLNSIHLTVPSSKNKNHDMTKRIITWKKNGILIADNQPSIYIYYQYFRLPGIQKQFVRKGFIAQVRIYEWHEKMILRHEDTMPDSVKDRIRVLEASNMHTSPIHGLYTDTNCELEEYMDESIRIPNYKIENYQEVTYFGIITDIQKIDRFVSLMNDTQIILADGHHRYESSLEYMRRQKSSNPLHNGKEGYNFQMMYFTNTESSDIKIIPTHRIFTKLDNLNNEHAFLNKLNQFFEIQPIENLQEINNIILTKPWTFGVIIPHNKAILITFKRENFKFLDHLPKAIRNLDLTILHHIIFKNIMGLSINEQRKSAHIHYERDFSTCVQKVNCGQAQMAFITQGISIDVVKNVCYSGYTLPQKSTYFYPKVMNGFVFSVINP